MGLVGAPLHGSAGPHANAVVVRSRIAMASATPPPTTAPVPAGVRTSSVWPTAIGYDAAAVIGVVGERLCGDVYAWYCSHHSTFVVRPYADRSQTTGTPALSELATALSA